MRALVWLTLLIPALAAGGTFVSGNSTLPGPKVDAKACTNPDPNKCLRAQDFNALRDAAMDLRDAHSQHVTRLDALDVAVAPILSLPGCTGGLYSQDGATGKLKCVTLPSSCGASGALVPDGAGGFTCKTFVTDPVTPAAETLRAFAGAEGTAANAVGGRGGTVYTVNSLLDTTGACSVTPNGTTTGTCTLRDCIAASEPRVCVFAVGGTITLASRLDVTSPYLTVAGQSAPGGGIQISGKSLTTKVVRIVTHDVVWRYTRVRKGYNAGTASQSGNPVSIEGGAYNVLFDHNSIAWTQDENVTIWSDSTTASPPRDITISWSVMAEPLTPHDTSTICGSNSAAIAAQMTGIDFVRNYLPNSSHRNPNFGCKSGRWVNNVVYNWDYYASRTEEGAAVDFINSVWKAGPMGGGSSSRTHEIHINATGDAGSPDGTPSVYVSGNKGPNHTDPAATSTEWADMVRAIDTNGEIAGEASASYKRSAALSLGGAPVVAIATASLETDLLATVGASRRLACDGTWTSARDAADARVVADYTNATGGTFTDETVACSGATCWPTLAAGTPCTDSDKDGMPDTWETAQGLNPSSAADAWTVATGQVYPNLERFLNGP